MNTNSEIQTKIHKCAECGRMFLDKEALQVHQNHEHLTSNKELESENPSSSLYFIKINNIWWPAENISSGTGEIIKVRVFNKDLIELEFDANNSKETKPFIPLERIPRNRSKEWKTGYEKALNIFNSIV